MRVTSKTLTAEKIHQLATMPLPRICTIQSLPHGGRTCVHTNKDSAGLFSSELRIEGYSFDRTNKG